MNSYKQQVTTSLPEIGFLRLNQIIGQQSISENEAERNRTDAKTAKKSNRQPNKKPKRSRPAIPAIIPVSKSEWYAGIKTGKYPKPIKLGARASAWKVSDILAVIERISDEGGSP